MFLNRCFPLSTALTGFVLKVVCGGRFHLPMVCFISPSCTRRSPLVWKWGSSSRQVAPLSILESRGRRGLLICSGSGVSTGVWLRLMAPLWLVLTHNWEIEPSQSGKYLSLLQRLRCLEIMHLTTRSEGYIDPAGSLDFPKDFSCTLQ